MSPRPAPEGRWQDVFLVFLRLGLTAFGGPVAHIGYFREAFVVRRRWLDDRAFADLVALCQFLPGPASSQVGLSVGLIRAGVPGALAAWTAFTLPSAILMVVFAYGVGAFGATAEAGWLHGLKAVAVAVVAQAVWGMARNLAPDRERATIAVAAAVLVTLVDGALIQVAAIMLAGAAGFLLTRERTAETMDHAAMAMPLSRRAGLLCLGLFAILLVGATVLAAVTDDVILAQAAALYRTGSLVFGGGHVVLPLLQAEVVDPGWVTEHDFLAGYGAAQAVPGPLFTFAAYVGAVMQTGATGVFGAVLCLVAIFLPSFLLVFGSLPFWDRIRRRSGARTVMRGVNAGVVGLLAAALYDPVWTAGVATAADFAVTLVAFLLLMAWKTPPWAVVVLGAAAGAGIDWAGWDGR
ncbi:MAG: chromate transporter [Rhodospirillaceae bacterium]|nr:chromate transporter [Rhodospirillaceae bacterium]